jgi:hypothetical protein
MANEATTGSRPASKPAPGPLVEDETVEGGVDDRGNAVIRPKPVDGARTDEGFRPTDARPAARRGA